MVGYGCVPPPAALGKQSLNFRVGECFTLVLTAEDGAQAQPISNAGHALRARSKDEREGVAVARRQKPLPADPDPVSVTPCSEDADVQELPLFPTSARSGLCPLRPTPVG
jgi:hypothetical protein